MTTDTKPPMATRTVRELGPRAAAGPTPHFEPAQPIRWIVQGEKGFNNVYRRNGKRVVAPSLAHTPDSTYLDRRVDDRTRQRYQWRLDHHGHEFPLVLSCGAGHVVTVERHLFSRDLYAQSRLDKAKALGWLDLDRCALVQIREGSVDGRRVLDRSLLDPELEACASGEGCPHLASEKELRQARNKRIQDDREEAVKSEDRKSAEATASLTQQLAAAVAKLAEREAERDAEAPKRSRK